VDATALAVSIALDTLRPAAPTTPPVDEPTPAPSPVVPPPAEVAPPPAPPPAEPRARWRPALGLDALVSDGSAPGFAAGFSAWGRLQSGRWSFGIEARADLPSAGNNLPNVQGDVSTWLVAGGLAPCFHLGPAFGCAVGQLGWLHAAGINVNTPKSGSDLFAAVGPRVGVEVDLNGSTQAAWTISPVAGTLGGGLAVHFP
jgi:hypothetical protein